jgi:hypothetical protein
MIATLAAMLRDERGTRSELKTAWSQFNGSLPRGTVPRLDCGPIRYPSLLQALKDGYQVYNQAPGVYFLRQRFTEGWKFAHVVSGDKTK